MPRTPSLEAVSVLSVLRELVENGPLRPPVIARRTRFHRQNVHTAGKALAEAGMIARDPHPRPGWYTWRATSKGRDHFAAVARRNGWAR